MLSHVSSARQLLQNVTAIQMNNAFNLAMVLLYWLKVLCASSVADLVLVSGLWSCTQTWPAGHWGLTPCLQYTTPSLLT